MSTPRQDNAMTFEHAASMGLSKEEWELILTRIGRTPNLCELGIFSAMWSEHCSYKSSKLWLKTLPTEGPQVVQGPGENAGAVDIGDGLAAIFKIESHNHPSFIEPYQGAATGVGGILRDVFTMGARPVALLNALRFGAADHEKTRHLLSGVVSGIGGYGNCIGIPTIGGEVNFDPSYNGNILVNAMAVGLANSDRIFRSAATGPGNPVIYVGAKTGRDGIHGATMASTEFSDETEIKAPHRPGWRPVHRQAADGGLPRVDGIGFRDCNSGHGRGRADVILGRNGVQRRPRHGNGPRSGSCPRGRHECL